LTLLTGGVLLARSHWPPRDLDATGVSAWRDLALTLALWCLTLALAAGLGRRILRWIAPPGVSRLEDLVFSFALGLGALGYAVLALSFTGLLGRGPIALLFLVASLCVGPDLRGWLGGVKSLTAAAPRAWRDTGWLARSVCLIGVLIAILAFLHALSPPWDYDGLMYHLVGPRLFLEAGRLIPYPDNWYVNAPFTLEMVFSLGMAFGDDVFPKLIHFATGVLLVAATFAAGRRWIGNRGGWLAAAVILAVPTLPIWASFAYIDCGWSLFEFLALVAAVVWWRDRSSTRWLVLSGVMSGLAMGTKYPALMGFAVLGVFVALVTVRGGWKRLVGSCLALALPAVIVASPWYLKNWLWFGNPVYPLYFGAPGWDPARLELYNAFLNSFGVGRSWLDYLLLPWNLYAQHARFGTVMNRIDVPGLLFPLVLLYPFLKKDRTVSALLWIALARGAVWALGTQQTRFLLPIFPALAVATAYVMDRWQPGFRTRIPWRHFLPMLAVGMMAITLFYQGAFQWQFRPLGAVIGRESRGEFLARFVRSFRAVHYAVEEAPVEGRVLLLGDGQGYYCLPACIPDPDLFRWAAEIAERDDNAALAEWFDSIGATHIMLSMEDLDFLLQHDPEGVMRAGLDRLSDWRQAGCLQEVFNDGWASVLAVTCR
jgi:hypothetical protein